MKHFIIITGFGNSQNKINRIIELSKKLKEKNKNFILCYSTHFKPCDKLYDFFDFVIYDKENLILNSDIRCEISKQFGYYIELNSNYTISYPFRYHAYAHHTTICNGIALGVSIGYSYMTVMNYDCRQYCIDVLDDHLEHLKKGQNVFYKWAEKGANTEFFSINNLFALNFCSYRSYDQFKKYKTIVYEHIFKKIIDTYYNQSYKLLENVFDDGSFGDFSYIENGVDKIFRPFYELENKKHLIFIPFINHNNKKTFLYSKNDIIKIKINDNLINDQNSINIDDQYFFTYLPDICDLKLYRDGKIMSEISLSDENDYGFLLQSNPKIPEFFSKNP